MVLETIAERIGGSSPSAATSNSCANGGMADTADSKPATERCGGSRPSWRTK